MGWGGAGVTALGSVAEGGLPEKGTFPQGLEGSKGETRGQVEGHEVTWADLPCG